jgi:hypothetical protein
MPIRVRHTVAVRTSRDTDFKQAMWDPDVPLSEVVLDNMEKQTNGNFAVPVTSVESLPVGDVTLIKGMYLEVGAACKVRVNGSLDSIDLVPGSSGEAAKFFLEADINQVDVENESTSDVLNGVYVFWGDPSS